MTQSSPTYGRGQRSRNRNKPVDYKRLAGEAGDFSNEIGSNNDDSVTSGNSNSLNYANKHVIRIINCNLDSSNAQVVDDGKILTADILKDPNHPLSLRNYILINDTPESIGMKVPCRASSDSSMRSESLSMRDLGNIIGMNHPVTVINVRNQEEMDGWTIGDLVEYFEDEDRIYQNASRYRSKEMSPSSDAKLSQQLVLNQISLEFSHTPLKNLVQSPTFVRDLDWIDIAWPKHRKDENDFPAVQYYCLTSTAGCYTDFHIDFGGSSVWYHVISGEKTFLLLPPSKKNVKLYEQWLCSKNQSDIFFLDMRDGEDRPDQCNKVTLKQGQTFIIPGGWIHAVYTPIDSIVLGGNFLHGLDIKCQLEIHCLETRIRVPAKFRFPYFLRMMFYAAASYLEKMQQPDQKLCHEEIDGLSILIDALKVWSIQPKEDRDRVGSIAHTVQECLSKFSYNWTINDMLVAIKKESKKYKCHSLVSNYSKNNINEELTKFPLTIKPLVPTSSSNIKNVKRSLKIRLSTPNVTSEQSNEIKQMADESPTSQITSPTSQLCSSENSENDFHISLCPSVLFDFKPMPDPSLSRRMPRKIEDLISRHRQANLDDEEWIPRQRNKKQQKSPQLTSSLSEPTSINLSTKVYSKKDTPSMPNKIEPNSGQLLYPKAKSTTEKSIDSNLASKPNFKAKSFIRKQTKKSSNQKQTIKNTSARQRLNKKFKF